MTEPAVIEQTPATEIPEVQATTPEELILQHQEDWGYFSTLKHVAADGRVYVEIDNVRHVAHEKSGVLGLLRDVNRLEAVCWHDGIFGWICAVERNNPEMERSIIAMGAKAYRGDRTYRYFIKRVLAKPTPMTFHDFKARHEAVTGVPWDRA